VREQLWVVVVRCGHKWVSSQQNLMTDLLLTALLGLALGAAQVSAAIHASNVHVEIGCMVCS
jgi:hypothetical protein